MVRTLVPSRGDTANFAVQSQTAPTDTASGYWQWSSRLNDYAPPLRFSAIDASQIQHDTYRVLVSGIEFGVAGGGVITLVQELVMAFSRRRDERSGA